MDPSDDLLGPMLDRVRSRTTALKRPLRVNEIRELYESTLVSRRMSTNISVPGGPDAVVRSDES
jgi:hypothetical protein